MPPPPPPEVFAYSIDPSLASWDVAPKAWIRQHGYTWDGLCVSVVVFDGPSDGPSNKPRVLLVQRAAHDSMPNLWEVPGGGASEEDEDGVIGGSILRAAARELWEEAGLVAARFTRLVPLLLPLRLPQRAEAHDVLVPTHPGHVFYNSTRTKQVCRFTFEADVRQTAPVTLDPNEHQDYVWATEEEVRQQRQLGEEGGKALPLTGEATLAFILEAFRLRRQQGAAGKA